MPTPPTLNLLCNIWKQFNTAGPPPIIPPTFANVPCNLQYTRKIQNRAFQEMFILLPKGTNVQDFDSANLNLCDIIECPAGSRRWYFIEWVDDVAKGFPTEYRAANGVHPVQHLGAMAAAWLWPVPYP